jgi:hypothetical protein
MVDFLIKKDQVELGNGDETIITSPTLKQKVEADHALVARQLSEYIGPFDASNLTIDNSGRVIIKDARFKAAAHAFHQADLSNLVCNDHHLICS